MAHKDKYTTLLPVDTKAGCADTDGRVQWDEVDAEFEKKEGSCSNLITTINLTKCFVGAASFELPWAFMQAGVVGSVLGVCCLAVLSRISLNILASTAHLVRGNGRPTYPAIGREAFGPAGAIIAWLGIIFMTLGVCGSYMVFVADTMAGLTQTTKLSWLLLQLPFLGVLSWLRTYKFLSCTALLGVIALFFAVVVTLYDCFAHHPAPRVSEFPLAEVETYPLFMGNAAYLYLISTAILPLSQSMTRPSHFAGCLFNSMVLVTVMNVVFGLIAWMYYGQCSSSNPASQGQCTQGNVIDNLTPGVLTTVVKVLLCVDLLFTNLMFLFPVSEALEVELLGVEAMQKPSWRVEGLRNLLRTVIVVAVALVAYSIPFFNLLTGLSGGFGNNLLGFILPPLFCAKIKYDRGCWQSMAWGTSVGRAKIGECFVCIMLCAFGLIFMGLSTEAFVEQIVKKQT